MKNKLLVLIITLTITSTIINAQKGIPDFSVTDIYGNTHTLKSDYLDKGKYVFIDFFNTTCQSCNLLAPVVDTVFRNFGCNYGDIIFLAIERGHDEDDTWEFTNNYVMTFPTISGNDGGGNKVHTDYEISFTPYKILISPNNIIVSDNPYSFNETAPKLRDTISKFGIKIKQCEGNNFMFYSLISSTDSIVGTINAENKTINVSFPSSKTNLSSLKAFFRNAVNSTITVNGIEQISGETINDFTYPVVYNITSETGITESWTVIAEANSNINYFENKFNIYPNPSDGIFVIENNYFIRNNVKLIEANIMNITGKIVKTITINKNNNIIDLAEFKKGIYFFNIYSNENTITKKLILY